MFTEHTPQTISFWITIYHSPLAIASFVSKTFILHFIKLEIIFPYKLNTQVTSIMPSYIYDRFAHWAFFAIQFDLFSRHKSEEPKLKEKNQTMKRKSSLCLAKRKVHNCLFTICPTVARRKNLNSSSVRSYKSRDFFAIIVEFLYVDSK